MRLQVFDDTAGPGWAVQTQGNESHGGGVTGVQPVGGELTLAGRDRGGLQVG